MGREIAHAGKLAHVLNLLVAREVEADSDALLVAGCAPGREVNESPVPYFRGDAVGGGLPALGTGVSPARRVPPR